MVRRVLMASSVVLVVLFVAGVASAIGQGGDDRESSTSTEGSTTSMVASTTSTVGSTTSTEGSTVPDDDEAPPTVVTVPTSDDDHEERTASTLHLSGPWPRTFPLGSAGSVTVDLVDGKLVLVAVEVAGWDSKIETRSDELEIELRSASQRIELELEVEDDRVEARLEVDGEDDDQDD